MVGGLKRQTKQKQNKKTQNKQVLLFWDAFFLLPRGNLRGVKPQKLQTFILIEGFFKGRLSYLNV